MNRDERLHASNDAAGHTGGPAAEKRPGPSHGWQPGPGAYPPPYVLRRPMNNLAIAALVVGLVSFVSCPLIGAIAIYLGNRARGEIRTTGEDGDGLALAGVIVGWCAVALAVLWILFFVVYIGFFGLMFSTRMATP